MVVETRISIRSEVTEMIPEPHVKIGNISTIVRGEMWGYWWIKKETVSQTYFHIQGEFRQKLNTGFTKHLTIQEN